MNDRMTPAVLHVGEPGFYDRMESHPELTLPVACNARAGRHHCGLRPHHPGDHVAFVESNPDAMWPT